MVISVAVVGLGALNVGRQNLAHFGLGTQRPWPCSVQALMACSRYASATRRSAATLFSMVWRVAASTLRAGPYANGEPASVSKSAVTKVAGATKDVGGAGAGAKRSWQVGGTHLRSPGPSGGAALAPARRRGIGNITQTPLGLQV